MVIIWFWNYCGFVGNRWEGQRGWLREWVSQCKRGWWDRYEEPPYCVSVGRKKKILTVLSDIPSVQHSPLDTSTPSRNQILYSSGWRLEGEGRWQRGGKSSRKGGSMCTIVSILKHSFFIFFLKKRKKKFASNLLTSYLSPYIIWS